MNCNGPMFWSDFEAAPSIEGLSYQANFLSISEEAALAKNIDDSGSWSTSLRRRVQHYGFRYDYRSRAIDTSMKAERFPEWLIEVAKKITHAGLMQKQADQAIVNEYMPGQGIFRHVDCSPCFGPEIVSVSLLAGCEMHFVNVVTGEIKQLYLERCSVVGMRSVARYEWMHGIAARRFDVTNGQRVERKRRLSITFRTVILQEMKGQFPAAVRRTRE